MRLVLFFVSMNQRVSILTINAFRNLHYGRVNAFPADTIAFT